MKRIDDDLTFINNINDAICENRIFALRIKKRNPYFLGLMERSAKIAYSFVVNLEDCLLQKESILCGTLQDSIDHVLNHEIFASELWRKFRNSPSNAAEAFLKHIECRKRKGEFDSVGHDIFMVSDAEFNNIIDVLCDGDYIFVIKDNDPVDDSETNCFESVDVSPKKDTDYIFKLNGIEALLPEIRNRKMTSLYENGDSYRCVAALERGYVDIEVNITTPEQCGMVENDNSPLISYFVCAKYGDKEDDWKSHGCCDLHPVQVDWDAPDWEKQLEKDMHKALDEYVIHNGLSYDKPNPPTSVNTENSLPETYTVISYWIGERESSKVWLYNTYKEATEGMARLWEQSFNLALEDEDFDEKNSYHEESFGVIAWDDNGLSRCFEVVNTSKTENIL